MSSYQVTVMVKSTVEKTGRARLWLASTLSRRLCTLPELISKRQLVRKVSEAVARVLVCTPISGPPTKNRSVTVPGL